MKQWWQQLQQREQQLVIAMTVLVVVFILFQGIWKPLSENVEKANSKYKRTQDLMAYVQENTALLKQSGKQVVNRSGGSLSSIVNRAASQYQITIDRVQPQGETVQVWIDEVGFNPFLQWLDSLSREHGLTVSNIDIVKGNNDGVVKVRRLQISRG